MGNEDERERERGGNIPGQELIGVDRSCVRTGSDTVLAIVLRQRHEQWMEGLGQAFPGARDLLEEMGLDPVSMSRVE